MVVAIASAGTRVEEAGVRRCTRHCVDTNGRRVAAVSTLNHACADGRRTARALRYRGVPKVLTVTSRLFFCSRKLDFGASWRRAGRHRHAAEGRTLESRSGPTGEVGAAS